MNKRDLYDLAEIKEKAIAALHILKDTKQPGESAGKVGKNEVLIALKSELKELLDAGYTTRQIAEAFRANDVFSILPKSITQAIASKPTANKRKHKQVAPAAQKHAEPVPVVQPAIEEPLPGEPGWGRA